MRVSFDECSCREWHEPCNREEHNRVAIVFARQLPDFNSRRGEPRAACISSALNSLLSLVIVGHDESTGGSLSQSEPFRIRSHWPRSAIVHQWTLYDCRRAFSPVFCRSQPFCCIQSACPRCHLPSPAVLVGAVPPTSPRCGRLPAPARSPSVRPPRACACLHALR